MVETQTENRQHIEEMLRSAEKADEPGELAKSRVVHDGAGELPTPMVATRLASAGYVYIYDTRTGDRSLTNRNMLAAQLGKKRPDGSNVFTTIRPPFAPKQGKLKCFLHADNPSRKHYDELGLPVCMKANLTSPFQVRRHMEKRHKMEWAAIEQERLEAEQARERLLREKILQAIATPQGIATTSQANPVSLSLKEFVCEECGASFGRKIALVGHKRKHFGGGSK